VALKLYLSQRTNRHVVKRLNSSNPSTFTYDSASFGTWQTSGSSTSLLSFPMGVAIDSSDNVYVCDNANSRIMKLNSSLAYVGAYDTSSTIGRPHQITYDSVSGDLYIVGKYAVTQLRIERITTALVTVRHSTSSLTLPGELYGNPMGIVKGFAANTFLIVGHNNDIGITTETPPFTTPLTSQAITGEDPKRYYGIIKHSTNGDLYLNDGTKILRVNSSFANIGDSNKITKVATTFCETTNGQILVYNNDEQKITRFGENMNFIADTYIDSGDVIATDAYDIAGMVEQDV